MKRTYHVHVQMDLDHSDPDRVDVHTIQRRVWCLGDLDRNDAFQLMNQLGEEIGETQAGIADRQADAHRG